MTTTETTATATSTGFNERAAFLLRMTEVRLAGAQTANLTRSATDNATWSMRDTVTAEAELELLTAAANTDRGEERFVAAVSRMLADSQRTTDAFAAAATEARREGALRTLRNLRGEMSTESLVAVVTAL